MGRTLKRALGLLRPLCKKIDDISDKQNRSQIQNSSVEEKTKVTMSVIGVEFNPYKNEGNSVLDVRISLRLKRR